MSVRVISWFSCGAASAVATKLAIKEHGSVTPVYCDTGAEHIDSKRFMVDCEEWLGTKITVIQSQKFESTWEVWEKRHYLAGVSGAPCTKELKVSPREDFQRPDDLQIFGYTADAPDVARAKRFEERFYEVDSEFPLIQHGLTKEACLAMIESAGIELPILYGLGFRNNNCIPCVKATSPSYWALIRQEFPAEFDRMVILSRKLGARLCRIEGERAFIDEIPVDQPTTNPLVPSCDFLCSLATQDIEEEA
jgi:3'-phosphoadenosine 5'-phosphosulfate sulfotransferase (PAPS reductase)/FAD synthetase